jgi:AraC family transcriptional regulator
MTSQRCPYCSLATKAGEVYCSKHEENMSGLKSGLFYINGKKFEECDWHVTRLSLNFNLDDDQSYFIGKREFRISPSRYLLINEGQSFKTFSANEKTRMVTLAFQVGLAQTIVQSWQHSHNNHLDGRMSGGQDFFEQTFPMDKLLTQKIHTLATTIVEDTTQLNEEMENVLAHTLIHQQQISNTIESINNAKASTRFEIYRRLRYAVEFAQSNFHHPLSVELMASQACFSLYHFKRLFKEVYQIAPYQFVRQLRLEKARRLLRSGMQVKEVCRAVGWEDTSSFIRLFKQTFHLTPSQFQSNFH